MKAVIQRVTEASISVEGKIISSIGNGLAVLAGFCTGDTDEDAEYILGKILSLRIFNDDNGRMNLSLRDVEGELLIVSQFTLCAEVRSGNRPSYSSAMEPAAAEKFYESFLSSARLKFPIVKSGIFGADMRFSLINSGPVTIILDSRKN